MSLSTDYTRRKFDAAYRDALNACNYKNYSLAKVKFMEAADCLAALASLEPANSANYMDKRQRILNLINSMPDTASASAPQQSAAGGYGSSQGQGNSASSASGNVVVDSATFSEPEDEEDMSQYYTFFPVEKLKFGFEGVIGLEEAKAAVTEYVINPILYPEAYNYEFISSKCILLDGPPGTGKTTFAKAVAKEVKQPFVLVNVASLVNCYVGETGKIIDKVFNSLRRYVEKNDCGITVFFDEFDEIAKSRTGDDKASMTAVPALLRNLDGMTENKNFLVLANTNCKDMLDAGVLSRFRRRIFIPLPDKGMREIFFKQKLAQLEEQYLASLDFDRLADDSEGMSGRTITQVCDDFLHYIGGVKAGLRSGDNLTAVLSDMINKNK